MTTRTSTPSHQPLVPNKLKPLTSRGLFSAALCIAGVFGTLPAQAETYQKPAELRVCQDPNNMPFSNEKYEGIENKIAQLFGKKLGVPVKYFSFPQRMAFVRNTIRYKLPGQDYRCDVMLGVPQRFGQVSTTNAYYRSTYALVYRKGGKLDGVKTSAQFVERARTALEPRRLGIHDKSPATALLNKYGLVPLAKLYQMLSPDPGSFPGQVIERDLVGGEIDAAIVWGPVAGYFGKKIKDPELVVVPMTSEPGVRFDFSIAMGVRHGEPRWKNEIQRLINDSQPEILAILQEFGVPLVNEIGDLIPPPPQSKPTASQPAKAAKQPDEQKVRLKAERDVQAAAAIKAKAAAVSAAAALAERQVSQQAEALAAKEKADAQSKIALANKMAKAVDTSTAKDKTTAVVSQSTKPSSASIYTVKDGYFVDANTLAGFKTWRAAACDRCHGANQEGLVGPSLIESLKVLTKDEFLVTVRDGRLSKGMQSFGSSNRVMDNIDNLYAYLKGRSEGAITQAKVKLIEP